MIVDHSPLRGLQAWGTPSLDHSPISPELKTTLAGYLRACKADELSKLTIDAYAERLSKFLAALPVGSIGEVTTDHIRTFMVDLQQRGLKPSTRNAYYRAMRTFFNWLVRELTIVKNPMQNIKPPKVPFEIVKPYSEEDIKTILELCQKKNFLQVRNTAIVLLFFDTGLRLDELSSIQLKDISPDYGTIKVMGKGNRERIVGLGEHTQIALYRYLCMRKDEYPCLWLTEEKKPLQRAGVQITMKRLKVRAGVKGVPSCHGYRHAFGTRALVNGADRYMVQELMGHTTQNTTKRYTASVTGELAVLAHRKFSPVDRMGLK